MGRGERHLTVHGGGRERGLGWIPDLAADSAGPRSAVMAQREPHSAAQLQCGAGAGQAVGAGSEERPSQQREP